QFFSAILSAGPPKASLMNSRPKIRGCQPSKYARTSSKSAAAPGDGRPDAFVKVIPGDFGYDLDACNRTGDLDPARQEPADRKGVERSQHPPTHGLKDRPCVRLCSPE